jgi:Kef-type K+ transport system membrane component KefB
VLLVAYGVLIGPRMSGLVQDERVVQFLYEVGFLVLMFLAGMEIDFNALRARGIRALLEMILVCLAIFGLAFGAAWLAGLSTLHGLALGATSVGLPLAILKETGRLRSPLGQSVVLLASVGEFLTVLGMTLFYFGSRLGLSLELVIGLAKLLGVLALAAVSLRALMAAAWWRPESFSALVAEREGSEIGVRTALVLMMVFVALSIAAGVETIVGAFLAGALLAFVLRGKEVLERKLTVVGHGLFIPLFFIIVGMRFDPFSVRGEHLSLAGLMLVMAFVVRLVPSLWLWFRGTPLRQMLATASLLSAPLTLIVAIAAIGAELSEAGLKSQQTLIVLALASGVVFPILFRVIAGTAPPKES